MTRLHVNIDHIATLRQARGVNYPDPVFGVPIVEMAGAHGITIHLREDRRHIVDRDVFLIKQVVQTVLNLEMSTAKDIVEIAKKVQPHMCTLVPENRMERTTEGGLAVSSDIPRLKDIIAQLKESNIKVSLFIDPIEKEIDASVEVGADIVELHTGEYCEKTDMKSIDLELEKIYQAAKYAYGTKLKVAAGHGLHYHNVASIARIQEIEELNIGHSIISRAVFSGLENAVKQMLEAMKS